MNGTFTKPEQNKHRKAFIEECRQKAWGAACHADWIAKGLAELTAHYQKLQAEDRALEEAITASNVAVDYHTVENRNKRKAFQERRQQVAQQMKLISENSQQAQRSLQQLYASVDSNLELAKFAEEWEWKEAKTEPKPNKPRRAIYILQKDWSDRKAGETLKVDEIGDATIYKDLIAQGIIIEG